MSHYKMALGLDYGRQKMGAAIGQEGVGSPRPLPVIKMNNKGPDWKNVDDIIEEWKPDFIVLGLPTNLDGTSNSLVKEIEKLGETFRKRYNMQVYFIDERLSSRVALQKIKAGMNFSIDSIAAGLILETWFEEQKKWQN